MLITKSHAQKILISDKEEHLFLELCFFKGTTLLQHFNGSKIKPIEIFFNLDYI